MMILDRFNHIWIKVSPWYSLFTWCCFTWFIYFSNPIEKFKFHPNSSLLRQ